MPVSDVYGGVSSAMTLLRCRLSCCAAAFGSNPCSSATFRTRAFVSAEISGLSFSARDTVDFESPVLRAMSPIVGVMQPVA